MSLIRLRHSIRIICDTNSRKFAGRADFQRIGALRPIGESPQKHEKHEMFLWILVLLTVESFAGRADFQRIGALRPIGESPQKTREARRVFVDSCVFCGHIFYPWLRLCRAGLFVDSLFFWKTESPKTESPKTESPNHRIYLSNPI